MVWLLDAGLQFQPYMFSHGFGREVIAPAALGQPEVVAALVRAVARIIARAPALANTAFASIQLGLGLGLVVRRWATAALRGTVAWSLGVWVLGEGMGGIWSGHASLLTGAPGPALLYLLVAAAAWARSDRDMDRPVSEWVLAGWAAVWGVGAMLQSLPGQASAAALAGTVSDAARMGPAWLAPAGRVLASCLGAGGTVGLAVVIALEVALGAAVFAGPLAARATAVIGALGAVALWVFGQGLGQLFSGSATDPNSGPLLVLLSAAVYSWASGREAPLVRRAVPVLPGRGLDAYPPLRAPLPLSTT